MLVETHHVAANHAEAARLALAAGVDYDLSDGSVYRTLLWQVKLGTVSESMVDRAVARILATKFRLGLFDNPYVDPDYAEKTTNGTEHRALALKAAQKAIVLLKNEKNLLPLDLSKLKTIAVIGPNAEGIHLGGYSRDSVHGVSILQGIKDRVGSKANVVYAEGCKITDAKNDWHGWFANDVKLIDPATQQDSVKAAAENKKPIGQMAREIVTDYRERKVRLPGYGHPTHTTDPRSRKLLEIAEQTKLRWKHVELAEQIESLTPQFYGSKLILNVDGCIAAIISDMGFDWRIGKGFFIVSRTPGLVAHAFEQAYDERPYKAARWDEIVYTGQPERKAPAPR
jgi:hypothetical protein